MNKQHLHRIAELDYVPGLARINNIQHPSGLFTAACSPMSVDLPNRAVRQALHEAIKYSLVLNSINYQFWDLVSTTAQPEPEFVRYAFEGTVGALGMQKALAKAWGEDATPRTFKQALRENGVEALFGNIPAARQREASLFEVLNPRGQSGIDVLEQVSELLAHRVLVDEALDVSDAALIGLMFPLAYGQDRYLKRAQLALSFIAAAARQFFDVNVQLDVTLFADYQVPRVARSLGLIEYGPELAQLVNSGALLAPNGKHERAIRAATVLMGRHIVQACKSQGAPLSEADLDTWLWTQRGACGDSLFHRTITTDY